MDDQDNPWRPSASTNGSPNSAEQRDVKRDLLVALLALYPQQRMDEGARRAFVDQWVDDMAPYHAGMVKEACATWRREQSARPTPAQLISGCRKIIHAREPKALDAPLPSRNRPRFDRSKFNPLDNPEAVRDEWRTFPIAELTRAERLLRHEEYLANCAARGVRCVSDAAVGFLDGAYTNSDLRPAP